jgi:hypothetical protein
MPIMLAGPRHAGRVGVTAALRLMAHRADSVHPSPGDEHALLDYLAAFSEHVSVGADDLHLLLSRLQRVAVSRRRTPQERVEGGHLCGIGEATCRASRSACGCTGAVCARAGACATCAGARTTRTSACSGSAARSARPRQRPAA